MLFNASLISAIGTPTNRDDWGVKISAALPSPRTITMKRDANSSAVDVWSTGTTFLAGQLVGALSFSNGDVSGFGNLKSVTTNLAADLSTGKSVVRIQSGSNYIEGTVGLTGSGADFILSASPNGSSGFCFNSSARIKAPIFLPSGKGPIAPPIDADAPDYVIIENWTNPNAVVEAGRIHFDTRIANWVFEDAEYASEVGDIRVTQSSESVTLGEFLVGAMRLSMSSAVNSEAAVPLHQVLISFRPTESNWPSYPRQTGATGGGLKKGTRDLNGGGNRTYIISDTFMPPFKAKICKADGTVLFTHDMPRDGLPINSQELSEVPTATKPLRPSMHCASLLEWSSHQPKMNSRKSKYFPGVASEFLRPSLMKERTSTNGCYPMYNIAQDSMCIGQWYAAPKWSQPCNSDALAADELSRGTNDPYLWTIGPSGSPSNNPWGTPTWATFYNIPSGDYGHLTMGYNLIQGWAYEPGSYSLHDHYTGPGGIRIDRAAIPTPIVMHLTDPNLKHMRDNTPIAEMVRHFNKAYFNHACHHVLDVKTFSSVPASEVLAGQWSYGNAYYNGQDLFGTGTLDKCIPLAGISQGASTNSTLPHAGAPTNQNYKMPWNGWAIDWYHNYSSPHIAALFYNSPAHAVSGKFRYLGSIMCQSGVRSPAFGDNEFMVRSQAWRWLQHGLMWKMASDHPLGIKRADIEARIEAELEAIYTNLYLPIKVNNSQQMAHRVLRNLGMNVKVHAADLSTPAEWGVQSWNLHYYMAHVLQMWRQIGLWKVMREKSDHCNKALLLTIECLDLGCIDYYLDTDGCCIQSFYSQGPNLWVGDRTITNDTPEVAANWADWLARVAPKLGPAQNFMHFADGSLRNVDIGEFSKMQWAFVRRDYFPDIPSNRDINACCAKIQGWIDEQAARVASQSSARAATQNEWLAHPALGRILPPSSVEP